MFYVQNKISSPQGIIMKAECIKKTHIKQKSCNIIYKPVM